MAYVRLFFLNLSHAIRYLFNPVTLPDDIPIVKYSDFKHRIRTGDIMAISRGSGVNGRDKIFGYLVSILTGYKIYHVATFMRVEQRIFVLEAIIPRVYLNLTSSRTPFYHIAIMENDVPTEEEYNANKERMFGYLGTKYSIWDAISAYWTAIHTGPNEVICTELCDILLSKYRGISLPGTLIPGTYVEELMRLGYEVTLVIPD